MDYLLLKNIIALLEEFQVEHASNRVEDFTIWLNNRLFVPTTEKHAAHDDLLISFKVMLLNKELKKQAKCVLSESNVSSLDEYSFLLHLDYQESFRKMEIIESHNLEAPTGIEIIKRLLKNGLIDEFPDSEDKRAKRIKISKRGSEEVRKLKPKLDNLFAGLTDGISLNEKIQLSGLLDKLIN
jgi:DNA-binding MarR family transcriptional regulator